MTDPPGPPHAAAYPARTPSDPAACHSKTGSHELREGYMNLTRVSIDLDAECHVNEPIALYADQVGFWSGGGTLTIFVRDTAKARAFAAALIASADTIDAAEEAQTALTLADVSPEDAA